ncbi:hypothetical protein M231_03896 [Tremella mesenterica]|uniref:Uncharacterized protein n=1 Tax=Tremella mesenterica TaxID=5217 RepID=A0A4Q1BM99_TREME|nr:hypothetical protein M231_03896 [Tremella mesenterica]
MGSSTSKSARKLPTSTSRPSPPWAGTRTPHPDPLFQSGQIHPPQSSALNPLGGYVNPTKNFSGEKDQAVRQDALDPQFMANLSRLGPVSIHDVGHFVKSPPLAQRTLSARQSQSQLPPSTLTAQSLTSLLDEIKTLPSDAGSLMKIERLYRQYGVDKQTMERLRRWVNSPSVGKEHKRVVEGEEIVELQAVWVDGPRPS